MSLRTVLDSAWIYFVAAGLLLLGGALSMVQYNPQTERPAGAVEELLELKERDDLNIVFIVIDMLRADRMESYGYDRLTSPVMTELASTGIRFARVESQSSWTKASMASMWQALYPERTGVQRYHHALTEDAVMPAEILSAAGYRTGGIFRNGWVSNNFGFGQGFDLYTRAMSVKRPGMLKGNPSASKLKGTDYDATEAAIGFMESYRTERFFLYMHYMDVHQFLYADTSPIYGTTVSDFYDSSIHWVDRNIGYVVNALKERNILHKTLIVIMSDHGEAFWEHGQEGHARMLFREVQQVPLLIIPPFKIEGGLVVESQVANVDIWPTILDLVGEAPLENVDGRSLVPLMLAAGSEAPPSSEAVDLMNRAVYSQLDRAWGQVGQASDPMISMIKDKFRFIWQTERKGKLWLYDQQADPLEARNIALEDPERLETLKQEIKDFLDQSSTSELSVEEIELDRMKLHQLRALGYVIDPGPARAVRKKAAAAAAAAAAPAEAK